VLASERFVRGLDEQPIAHRDHPLRDARDPALVRHDEQRDPLLGVELAQEFDDVAAGIRIEAASRLVAQEQLGRTEQRSRDRDAR
jgi:hypothetical protein